MRFLIACVIMLAFAAIGDAQDTSAVTCPDGSSVTPQLTLTLPSQSPVSKDEPSEPYFLSAVTEIAQPTLAITDENAVVSCTAQDMLSETVQATYTYGGNTPARMIGLSPYSAWIGAETLAPKTLSIGSLTGESLLMIEGGHITSDDDDGDVYTFTFDPSLMGHFDINVLGIDDTYQPRLSLVDDTNTVLSGGNTDGTQPSLTACQIDVCQLGDDFHISYNGLRVPEYESRGTDIRAEITPGTSNTLHVRVDSNGGEGAYTLLVRLYPPRPEVKTIPAQAVDNGDGSWTVRCGQDLAFENGIKVDILTHTYSSDTPLTLTALGEDTPITIAVMTSPTEGSCVEQTDTASSYAVALPDLTVSPTLNSAQVVLTDPTEFILIGSEQQSQITLIAEGWQTPIDQDLGTAETPEWANLQTLFALNMIQAQIENGVHVYAVAADDTADPLVAMMGTVEEEVLKDGTDTFLTCDNAGVPDECHPDSSNLTGYSITLADGRVLPGASLDAMLRFNTVEQTANTYLLHINAGDRTGKGGPLVIVTAFILGGQEPLTPQ